MKPRTRIALLLLLYVLACALPAFNSRHGEDGMPGIYCLILVPIVMIYPAWWANPLFFAGCVSLARGKDENAMALGLFAFLLACSIFLTIREGLGIGGWFWMASMAGLTLAGFAVRPGSFKPDKVEGLEDF